MPPTKRQTILLTNKNMRNCKRKGRNRIIVKRKNIAANFTYLTELFEWTGSTLEK
jgi:hypothetical protein